METDLRELIEKQIEEAADILDELSATFERPREISNGIIGLIQGFERILQIVQNQQALIEAIQKEAFDAAVDAAMEAHKDD
jgi:t-SNARE complex subunit (syntaxin)